MKTILKTLVVTLVAITSLSFAARLKWNPNGTRRGIRITPITQDENHPTYGKKIVISSPFKPKEPGYLRPGRNTKKAKRNMNFFTGVKLKSKNYEPCDFSLN